MNRPKVHNQGLAVAERSDGGDWIVMLPDGSVEVCTSKAAVQRTVKRWAKQHADDTAVNALTLEWRE